MPDNPFIETAPPPANPFITEAAGQITPPSTDVATRKFGRRRERYSSDRAERMRQMQEDGLVGPQFGKLGGGARKKSNRRATEVIAEMAQENAEHISKTLLELSGSDYSAGTRLAAIDRILKAEGEETKITREDEAREIEAMQKNELVDYILEGLGQLQKAGTIADADITIAEADVVEID